MSSIARVRRMACGVLLAAVAVLDPAGASAQTSAFTYQGRLDDSGTPVNGSYEFEFTLWNAPGLPGPVGIQIAGPDLATATVSDGLFTVEVDFGNAQEFLVDSWLEIRVRALPAGVFQALTPRQRVTPAPTAEVAALARQVELFPGGISNPDRMVIAHSPANPDWGLLYQDSVDVFRFLGAGVPILSIDLGARDLDIGESAAIFFAQPTASDPAMIHMFENAQLLDRMVIAHSPAFPNWGLQYQDVGDTFRFLRNGTPVVNIDLSDSQVEMGAAASLTYSNPGVGEPAMIHMFASGATNPDRMVIAHSPGQANWGLQYQDTFDTFRFLQAGLPVFGVDLQSRELQVGNNTTMVFSQAVAGDGPMIEMFPSGTANADRMVIAHSAGFADWGLQYQDSSDKFNFLAGGSSIMTVSLGTGTVGIDTATPAFDLHVNGTAGKPGGGSWAVASDARLKTNVRDLHGALERLLALRGVTFEFKDPASINELPGVQTGMIAQEVEKVFPEWIAERPDGYKSLSPHGFEALTVEALRELRTEKDAQISRLTAENADLRARLEALETIVAERLADR